MRRLLVLLVFFLTFALTGCGVNPVTGENTFVLPNLDENWERNVGTQMYASMRQAEGGDYILDPALTEYVVDVGERLTLQAKRDLPYEFHIINNSVPNAWALPGGKIVVNRGLLTELGSEAELAAVLGHEIVHADAAHGARQQSKGMLTQVGMMAAMIYGSSKADTAAGQQIAMIVPQIGAQLITTKYGRDSERESDLYGMQYMSSAGYDPEGAVQLQETFVVLSQGRQSDWLSGLFASHPPSNERVANNRATAERLPKGGEVGRDIFLSRTAYLREKKPAYEAHDSGRKALEEDNPREARRLVSEAIRIEPREAIFYALSGDIYASENQLRKAEREYTEALERDSSFFYQHLRRGQVRYERGNFAAARVDLDNSLELLPTAQANYLLGNLDKRAGNMDSAVKHYQAASESNSAVGKDAQKELVLMELPGNPGKYIQSAPVLEKNGQVSAAVRNRAPLQVNKVRVKVEYIDANRQLQEFFLNIRGTLEEGEYAASPTDIRDIAGANDLARRVRVTVVRAEVVE